MRVFLELIEFVVGFGFLVIYLFGYFLIFDFYVDESYIKYVIYDMMVFQIMRFNVKFRD